jgi:hypothetical protein
MKSDEEIKSIYEECFQEIYEKNFDKFFDGVYKSEKECRNQSQYESFKEENNYSNLYFVCKDKTSKLVYKMVREDFINYNKKNILFEEHKDIKKKKKTFFKSKSFQKNFGEYGKNC